MCDLGQITTIGHVNFRPAKLQAKRGFATATHQINILILGVNYVSTCCPKPVMLTIKFKREKFYLMSITKFTNLSGNQVPLVLLHINSVNIILKEKYKVKTMKSKIKEHQGTHTKKIQSIPLPFSPFFSSSAGSPHPVKAR